MLETQWCRNTASLGLEGGVFKEQTRPRVSWGHGPAGHRQGQGPEEPRGAGVSAV